MQEERGIKFMEIKDKNGKSIVITLLISEITSCLNDVDGDLTDKLKIAMQLAKSHWLVTDDDAQFRGAIAGVMLHYGEGSEEYKRLEWEYNQLKKLNIAMEAQNLGVEVSFGFLLENEARNIKDKNMLTCVLKELGERQKKRDSKT